MEAEIFFSDEMISEEFHDVVAEKLNPRSCFKNALFSSFRSNKPRILKISENEVLHQHQNILSDTMSLDSVESSGSSLNEYESQPDNTFCMNSNHPSDRNNLQNTLNETPTEPTLNDLKAAIEVKWMDRSFYMQKSIQNNSADLWGNFLHCDEPKMSCSAIIKSAQRIDHKCYDMKLADTLDSASKIKQCMPIEEVRYTINNYQVMTVIPKTVEIQQETSVLVHKTKIHKTDLVAIAKLKSPLLNLSSGDNDSVNLTTQSRRNDNCSSMDEKLHDNLNFLYEENKCLAIQLVAKTKHLDNLFNQVANYKTVIAQFKENLQVLEGNQTEYQKELFKYKTHKTNLEKENAMLRANLENMKLFRASAENKLMAYEKTREIMEQQLDAAKNQEIEYQWLFQAYNDYKALGHDYDILQRNCADLENQLVELAHKNTELYKQVDSLKDDVNYYQDQLEKLQSNQNQYYENIYPWPNYCDRSYSPHRSKSNHRKSRKKERTRHKERNTSLHNPEYVKMLDREKMAKDPYIIERQEPVLMDPKELDNRYDMLQMKKRQLESELCHVPLANTTNRKGSRNTIRGEKEKIEDELDKVDLELSSIRRQLKQQKSMQDPNPF